MILWQIPSKDPGFSQYSYFVHSTLQFISLPMYDSHSAKAVKKLDVCCIWAPFIRCVIVALTTLDYCEQTSSDA